MSGSAVDIKPLAGAAVLARAARAAGSSPSLSPACSSRRCRLRRRRSARATVSSVPPSGPRTPRASRSCLINAQMALAQTQVAAPGPPPTSPSAGSRAGRPPTRAPRRPPSRPPMPPTRPAPHRTVPGPGGHVRPVQLHSGKHLSGYAAVLTSDGPGRCSSGTRCWPPANGHRTDVLAVMTTAADQANAADLAAAAAQDAAAAMKQQAQTDLATATAWRPRRGSRPPRSRSRRSSWRPGCRPPSRTSSG